MKIGIVAIGVSALSVLLVGAVALVELPEARVTVLASDETGLPVADADAGIGFLQIGKTSFSTSGTAKEGKTDAAGKFTGADRCLGEVGYNVKKSGYYSYSSGPYRFLEHRLGRWEPYDPTFKVVLKKIVHPVPMYAKRTEVLFPLESWPLGFDLLAGDWVAPYGTGTTADFVFRVDRTFRGLGDFDTTVALAFSNPGDGIQEVFASLTAGSALRLDRLAPEAGYLPKWSMGVHQAPGRSVVQDEREDRNYYFRVRTVMRDGKVISALYGKIRGDFQLGGFAVEKVGAVFTYYLNPDGTRNLEFDPTRNLFVHTPSLYKPNDP